MDPDLDLISALPDAVKRQIHHHLVQAPNKSHFEPVAGKLPPTICPLWPMTCNTSADPYNCEVL